MAITQREETIWNMIWLLVGVPAMITGIVVGAHFDDLALLIGAPLVIPLILFVTRDTLLPLLERTVMFGRPKKEKPVLRLTVVDSENPDRIGTVEALSNHGHIKVGSRLLVLQPSRPRQEDEPVRAGVYIGRTGAATVRTEDRNLLRKDRVLVVRSIEGHK